MKLSDLDARFIQYEQRTETWDVVDGDPATWRERGCPTKKHTGLRQYLPTAATLAEAQGVMFQCPICVRSNGHYVEVTFADRGVPDECGSHSRDGDPSRWQVSGTGFHDLTTRPSIWLQGGCGWHGYITSGNAQ